MHFTLDYNYKIKINKDFQIYFPLKNKGPFTLKEIGPNLYSFNTKDKNNNTTTHTVDFFM
jgi:hypothetical protein